MSAPAFSPGPLGFCWNVPDITKQEPTSGVAWFGKGDIKGRCRVDVSGPNTLANAHLIAAAHELYDALEKAELLICLLTASQSEDEYARSVVLEARAARAKARGEA